MTSAPFPPASPHPPSSIGPTGKAYIASLRSTAATWNQSAIDLDVDHADLMFFYCFDSVTGCRWLGQATHSSFRDLCEEVREDPNTWKEHLNDLDRVISASIQERKSLQAMESFTTEDLIPTELLLMQSLACMAASTETAGESQYHPGCHFIVVRHAQSGLSHFRTIFLAKESIGHPGPLSDNECANLARLTLDDDKISHPHWFWR